MACSFYQVHLVDVIRTNPEGQELLHQSFHHFRIIIDPSEQDDTVRVTVDEPWRRCESFFVEWIDGEIVLLQLTPVRDALPPNSLTYKPSESVCAKIDDYH
jgi:hypothetical protein